MSQSQRRVCAPALDRHRTYRFGRAYYRFGPNGWKFHLPSLKAGVHRLNVRTVASWVGVSGKTVLRAIRKGWLPAFRTGSGLGRGRRGMRIDDVHAAHWLTIGKAARFFGCRYERLRRLLRADMEKVTRRARRRGTGITYRVSLGTACALLNQETRSTPRVALRLTPGIPFQQRQRLRRERLGAPAAIRNSTSSGPAEKIRAIR